MSDKTDDFYVNSESMLGDQRLDSPDSLEEDPDTMRYLHQVEEAHESLRTDKNETPRVRCAKKVAPRNTALLSNEASWTPLDQQNHDIQLDGAELTPRTPRKNMLKEP